MKTWEIIKGMSDGTYREGDIFQSEEIGDMIISEDGELCYIDYETVPMITNDETEWKLVNRK